MCGVRGAPLPSGSLQANGERNAVTQRVLVNGGQFLGADRWPGGEGRETPEEVQLKQST